MSGKIRCAIYTRKSTEEGLEQEFNSLDAQRESCEAYIKSQRELRWLALPSHYDDGGISGGTIERPALQRLLSDIKARKVDTIVVYKVDRLTRSLSDFAKIVDVFDAHGVTFVSVTQQFNTTTSMGRLTLNMLLSFAQFEREVTGERIRDKIAASKKKGMWMGGLPSLGYEVKDKKLVVNQGEAKTVRTLFRLYLELGTVRELVEEASRLGLVTKRRVRSGGQITGGHLFTSGHLHQLLTNAIYAGEVVHKGTAYPGQHDAIIEQETFEAVQHRLSDNAATRYSATNTKAPSLLTGLIFDETGDRLCPTHANKRGRRYRYYVSKRLMHRTGSAADSWRVPAKELDGTVVQIVGKFLKDKIRIIDTLRLTDTAVNRLKEILRNAAVAAGDLTGKQPERRRQLLHLLIHRVTLHSDSLQIEIRRSGLNTLVSGVSSDGAGHPADAAERKEDLIDLTAPVRLKRRGVEAKLVLRAGQAEAAAPDKHLIALLVQTRRWISQLAEGEVESIQEIAQRDGIDASDVGRTLQLAFLAPDLVEAILAGRQPVDLTARRLKRIGALPFEWDRQRRLLGFAVRARSQI